MRKHLKILSLITICICLFFFAKAVTFAASGDEVRAAKKIISVVYDDSGSMAGERWVYTSYAMQALTALLNEQDELYITYMSQPAKSVPVEMDDMEGALKKIREWNLSGGTPGEALDTAKAVLDGITESDVSTQFWLVIMTDGEISMDSDLQNKMDSFKGASMSNGDSLKVVYLGMGDSAETVKANEGGGLYSYMSQDNGTITDTMGEVANLVSGRITADQVTKEDDYTVSFQSSLPLYSISVLSQQSAAAVESAETDEGTLNIKRNLALDAKEPFQETDLTLYGNAAVINKEDSSGTGQVIPKGTYTITFSEKVDINNLVIQYEPAIGLKAVITRSGIVIDDAAVLGSGDKVDITIRPVVPGTDEEIDVKDLPDQVSWGIEYEVDGTKIDAADGVQLTDVTLQKGGNIVRGIMQIPGYAPSVREISFDITEIVYNLGIDVEQPEPLTYLRGDLTGGSEEGGSLCFRITNDGTALSKEELETMGVGLEVDSVSCDNSGVSGVLNRFGKTLVKCRLRQNDDGSYTLEPKEKVAFTAFLIKAGDYTVQVKLTTDETVTASGTFSVVPRLSDWGHLPILIGILILLLYLLYIIFIKYKFKGQVVHYEAYRLQGDGSGAEQRGAASSETLGVLKGHLFLPARACFVRYRGLKLVAGPDGMVTITGNSIAKAVYSYGTSGGDPTGDLESIVSRMHSTVKHNNKREAADQTLSKRPIYFRNSENDKIIWRLWMKE